MADKQLTINLNKTTILFGVILLALGYFVGNTLPITGGMVNVGDSGTNTIVVDSGDSDGGTAQQQGGDTTISLSIDDDPTIGDLNAPVQVYEFSDFQCPFCTRFYSDSVAQMKTEYIDTGKVLFVYKDFPLQQIHPAAVPAAVYANCANQQGKWEAFHDLTFENQHLLGSGQAGLDQIATDAGLDAGQLASCLENQEELLAEVQGDLTEGQALGVSGTPSVFIGNEEQGFTMIRGAQPYSVVKQAIEQYL